MQSLGKRGELSVELNLTGAYVVLHGYCVCLADVSCGRQVIGKKMSLRLERESNKKALSEDRQGIQCWLLG